jgi:hypothetical protein
MKLAKLRTKKERGRLAGSPYGANAPQIAATPVVGIVENLKAV